VEASNLCARTLIFSSFSFIVFLSNIFHPFSFFWFSVLLPFSVFDLVFLLSFVSPFFFAIVLSIFFGHVVLSLAYPTCLRLKELVG
jgi:hypothetical protein